MRSSTISPSARGIESLFDSPEPNSLQAYMEQQGAAVASSQGLHTMEYDLFLVRRNDRVGTEIMGPKNFHVGNYSEQTLSLYGVAGSLQPKFRPALRALAQHAHKITQIAVEETGPEIERIEYFYQVTLFWADIGKLKEFLGISPELSELVTGFLTARFQFIGRDTPVSAMKVLAKALTIAADANRHDTALVDQVVDTLDAGGMDSLAFDVLRKTDD